MFSAGVFFFVVFVPGVSGVFFSEVVFSGVFSSGVFPRCVVLCVDVLAEKKRVALRNISSVEICGATDCFPGSVEM